MVDSEEVTCTKPLDSTLESFEHCEIGDVRLT